MTTVISIAMHCLSQMINFALLNAVFFSRGVHGPIAKTTLVGLPPSFHQSDASLGTINIKRLVYVHIMP